MRGIKSNDDDIYLNKLITNKLQNHLHKEKGTRSNIEKKQRNFLDVFTYMDGMQCEGTKSSLCTGQKC